MNGLRLHFFLSQVKNVKWQRSLSSNVSKVDDYTIKCALSAEPSRHMRLFDRIWADSSIFKDKIALVSSETEKTYTYAQLQKFMLVFATSLLTKLGLKSNDIVAVALPNCPEYPVVTYGALQAGCIVTTINPAYKNYELVHQLTTTKPKLVVTIPQVYNAIKTALNDAKLIAKIVIVEDPSRPVPDGVVRYSEIAESGEVDYALLDKVEKNNNDVAILPFSSGTTGLPKGVEITYKNMYAAIESMSHEKLYLASLPDDTSQDIVPCVLPFFHIYGLMVVLLGHLLRGCKLITMANFKPNVFLNTFKSEKVTLLFGVPPLLLFLGKNPTVKKEYFKHLRFALSAAAPLSGTDMESLLEKLNPKTQFLQGYGLTELTGMGTITYKNSEKWYYGSCGDPTLNMELRFADANTGGLVPIGESGEVLIRAPYLMKGYYKNEEATKECMTDDGFYKTGDVGVYKSEGGLYILDRLKELIKVKGMQVAPAELESVLRTHPSVLDVGVIGIPDPYHGQVPKACVVLNKDKPATDEELKAYVADKVAGFKAIHKLVFVDSIPKTASGKILRVELRNMY